MCDFTFQTSIENNKSLNHKKDYNNSKAAIKSSYSSRKNGWMLLDHAALLTSQATILTANFFTHHLSGPTKPSWPIQLTLLCAAMRSLTDHTHLADINSLRRLINVTSNLVPSDIIITPVSFKVLNRGLKGILENLEEQETGNREISCEWVVPKSLWRKINEDYRSSAACCKHYNYGIKWSNEKVIMHIHGGAYYLMSAKTHRELNYRISKATGRRVFAINYRLAPEGPFPCGLHDAVHSFLYLTDPNGMAIQPENIVIVGDSAGGGLTMALLFYLRDNNMPLPGGAVLFSPWVDLTMSSASWDQNKSYDYLFKPKDDDPLHPVRLYLHPHEERSDLVTNPYVSPLYGDLNNLPPLLIQYGDSEVLRDEICLFANKASETETTFVQHEVYEDMVHVFQMFNFLEPATKAIDSVGYFVKNIIPIHQRNTFRSRANQYRPVELKSQNFTSDDTSPPDFSQKVNKVDKSTSTQEDGIIVNCHHPSNNSCSRRTKDYNKLTILTYPIMNTSLTCFLNRNNKNGEHHNNLQQQQKQQQQQQQRQEQEHIQLQPIVKPSRSSSYPGLKQVFNELSAASLVKSDAKIEQVNNVNTKEVSVGIGPDNNLD